RLCGTGFRFPTITAALKEFDQFALRAGVDLLVRWFHSRRPPCRTSRQDYRRSCLPTPRRCCPRCQLHAPAQKSTRSARRIAPSAQQFSSPQQAGATKADNGESAYHPLLAFWAEAGEWLCSHRRRGSAHTGRNGRWFLRETLKRVPGGWTRPCAPTAGSTASR